MFYKYDKYKKKLSELLISEYNDKILTKFIVYR